MTSVHRVSRFGCAVALLGILAGVTGAAQARPIAFADGVTIMSEYGAETMREYQAFYAPSYRYSFGAGHLSFKSHIPAGTPGHSHGAPSLTDTEASHGITYLRFNYLPKRWNLESAQANIFVWASAGQVRDATEDLEFAGNVGAQFDYETRRIYASLRTDLHESSFFRHRIDTLQLGVAPYEHDYNTLAVWFLVQARQYSGELLHHGTEFSALVRLFKRKSWIEAGVTQEGRVQAMLMFNF